MTHESRLFICLQSTALRRHYKSKSYLCALAFAFVTATLPQVLHVRHYVLDPRLVSGNTQADLTPGHQTTRSSRSQVRSCVFVMKTVAWTLQVLTWWHRKCSPVLQPDGGSPQPFSLALLHFWPTSSSPPVPLPGSLEDGGDHISFVMSHQN